MSGKGKKIAKKSKQRTQSSRAGLTFPVGRVTRHLKHGRYAKQVSPKASVFLASVMEYLVAELLELSGGIAKEHKKGRISPRHIQLAISNDEELSKYLASVTIAQGGVLPNIHDVLVAKKK